MKKQNSRFNFFIFVSKIFICFIFFSPIYADTLYVSINGDDVTGDGTELNPWKTITFALSQTSASSSNPQTVYVKSGTYSPSLTGEMFSLSMKSYLSLIGEDSNTTILDAENTNKIISCFNIQDALITGFSFTNGQGGGIFCMLTTNLTIQNNVFYGIAGTQSTHGTIQAVDVAEVLIVDNVIANNQTSGLSLGPSFGAIPVVKRNIIKNNISSNPFQGGGIILASSKPIIGNTLEDANDIYNNSPYNLERIPSPNQDTIQVTLNYWGSIDINVISQTINGNNIKFIPYTDSLHANIIIPTSIGFCGDRLPLEFKLHQNHPNPFNPTTKIRFEIPKSTKVKIEVFNLLGQKIKTLFNKQMVAGSHQIKYGAYNLPSGVYLYRIEAGEYQEVKKMVLLR